MLLISDKKQNYVCRISKGKLVCDYVFAVKIKYAQDGNETSQQGSVLVKGNKYYLVSSHAYANSVNAKRLKRIWDNSYVYKYTLTVKKNTIKASQTRVYRLNAGKKVSWKKKVSKKIKKKENRKFEMEDLYVYNGMFFFNAEGGSHCNDLIGVFSD